MRFGVHVGIGKGFERSVEEALHARCDCIQIFAGNPRGWRTTAYDPGAWSAFAQLRRRHGLAPTVIHTSYLINLASSDSALRRKSEALVAHDLDVAAKGKIEYVNTHLGSYGDQPRRVGFNHLCRLLGRLIDRAAAGPGLLLENSAGGGNKCGGSIEELGRLLREIGNRRIGVCLDTAHLWASGYKIDTPGGVRSMLDQVEKHIGLRRVPVWHLNDTQVALGARHDLHWHLGKGRIGAKGFRSLLDRPELSAAAFICETPKPHALDRRNVEAARRFARSAGCPELSSRRRGTDGQE